MGSFSVWASSFAACRSVQQEFEENEGGAWLQQLSYVTLTEHPAKPKEEWPAIEKYEKAKAHQTA